MLFLKSIRTYQKYNYYINIEENDDKLEYINLKLSNNIIKQRKID